MGLKQLIGKIAKETVDASNPVQILSATVVSAPPEISIKLKNNDKLIFEKESLLIAEKLTTHSKKMRITSSNANLSGAVINSAMSSAGSGHTHSIRSIGIDGGRLTAEVEVEFLDELQVGDKVVVEMIQGGEKFLILDRYRS